MSFVQIPSSVRMAAARFGLAAADAQAGLSQAYRDKPGRAVPLTESAKRAYLAARLPATYAAVMRSLERYKDAGGPAPGILLDAGCGPGTAGLAAAALFPGLLEVTRSDIDVSWRPVADALGAASGHDALKSARWLTRTAAQGAFPTHDMVIAAYMLNEVPGAERFATVQALWAAAAQALILVEPGTPQGFLNIQAARSALLGLGAHVAAPCTHHNKCPMSEQDWCHSAVRLSRDAAHREAKGATLSYEDEKFAFLAVTRAPVLQRPQTRIVKNPAVHSGHVRLDLCGREGLSRTTTSRRDGALYKAARKAEWGDRWPPDQEF